MLYLIGGASRSGKSTVARELLKRNSILYFALDVLMMGLHVGYPQLGIGPDIADPVVTRRLWPVVRGFALNLLDTEAAYAIEGVFLRPQHMAELEQSHPATVRGVFIGYSSISPATKLRHIRAASHLPNDWLSTQRDAYILALVYRNIRRSRNARILCARLGVKYVDTSRGFAARIEQALAWLIHT